MNLSFIDTIGFEIKHISNYSKLISLNLGSKKIYTNNVMSIMENKKYLLDIEVLKRSNSKMIISIVDINNKNKTYKEFIIIEKVKNIKMILFSKETTQICICFKFIRPRIGDFMDILKLLFLEVNGDLNTFGATSILSLGSKNNVIIRRADTIKEKRRVKPRISVTRNKITKPHVKRRVEPRISVNRNKITKPYVKRRVEPRISVNRNKITKPYVKRKIGRINTTRKRVKKDNKPVITKAILSESINKIEKAIISDVKIKKNINDRTFNLDKFIRINNIDSTYFEKNPFLQILFPISEGFNFLRTIMLPDKHDNIYYIIPSTCQNFIKGNFVYKKLLSKMFFISTWEDILQVLIYLNPIKIFLSVYPYIKIVDKLKEYISRTTYIHHGIIVDNRIPDKIEKGWHSEISYLVPNKVAEPILRAGNLKNVSTIKGLPQFDYVLKNKIYHKQQRDIFIKKHNLNEDTKIILLIHGSSPGKYYSNMGFMGKITKIVESMISDGLNVFMIIKFKYKYRNVINNNYVTSLTNSDNIYDYYFSDAIIVVEGGTALVETLIGVPQKTLFIDWLPNLKNFYKVKSLNIIKAIDQEQLKIKLTKLLRDGVYDDINKINEEAEKYINDILGYKGVELISDDILEDSNNK